MVCQITAEELLGLLPEERPRHVFRGANLDYALNRTAERAILGRTCDLADDDDLSMPDTGDYHAAIERARALLDTRMTARALNFLLTGDPRYGLPAKRQMLELLKWPISVKPPFDELGLSAARTLPAAFDWLYKLCSPEERRAVAGKLAKLAAEIEERIQNEDFLNKLHISHTSRLPGYLGEAALVLHGSGATDERAIERWLDFAISFYTEHFPFYGDADGGWAEGVFYASSYTKWFLPFFAAVKQLSGCDLTCGNPFYRNLANFFIHFAPPGQERHPFGDGHWDTREEWRGFQAQDPFSVYANNQLARKFSRLARQNMETARLHVFDLLLPPLELPESEAKNSFCARRTGFVSMREDAARPEESAALLARASEYGAISHQHADQGDFAIFCRNEQLTGPSGNFGAGFGSRFHRLWTAQTVAHNCFLIDGRGQNTNAPECRGAILETGDDGKTATALLELSQAYPSCSTARRRIEFDRSARRIVVTDRISCRAPSTLEWLLHFRATPEKTGGAFLVRGRRSRLCFATPEGAVATLFEVPPEAAEPNMPEEYHLRFAFKKAKNHVARVVFEVEKI